MEIQKFTLRVPVKIPDEQLAAKLKEQAVTEGWGVLEHGGGIASMDRTELRSVWEVQEAAESEADRLNDTEGVRELEIEDDLDSNVYREVYFNAGRVALVGVEPEITLSAVYKPVA